MPCLFAETKYKRQLWVGGIQTRHNVTKSAYTACVLICILARFHAIFPTPLEFSPLLISIFTGDILFIRAEAAATDIQGSFRVRLQAEFGPRVLSLY